MGSTNVALVSALESQGYGRTAQRSVPATFFAVSGRSLLWRSSGEGVAEFFACLFCEIAEIADDIVVL